jgi:hypothetical protein
LAGIGYRRRIIEYFVIGLMLIVVIGLLITMLRVKKDDYQGLSNVMAKKQRSQFEVLKPCPLCGYLLRKGETVKSKVIEIAISGKHGQNKMGVKESMAHMFGCPYCWPSTAEHPRHCPACKATLESSDYVIGRYFEKDEGKNHLHVLGCTRCRKS